MVVCNFLPSGDHFILHSLNCSHDDTLCPGGPKLLQNDLLKIRSNICAAPEPRLGSCGRCPVGGLVFNKASLSAHAAISVCHSKGAALQRLACIRSSRRCLPERPQAEIEPATQHKAKQPVQNETGGSIKCVQTSMTSAVFLILGSTMWSVGWTQTLS